MTRLLARSSRPKQQNSRANPLRLRGARPSYGFSLMGELDEEDVGLNGMVALMKMSESRLRCCRAEASVFGDASVYGGGGSV